MGDSPWKKISGQIVFENPWIRVEQHEVINPGGGKNLYGKIFYKNVAVGIVAIDDEDHTYLVGQHRYTLDEYSWELPMGGAPLSEDPLTAARRELKEETGLTAGRWRELMRLHPSNSVTDERGVLFLAEELIQGEPELEETEDITVKRLPLGEAIGMAERGEITDAMSVAGLLLIARIRDSEGGAIIE